MSKNSLQKEFTDIYNNNIWRGGNACNNTIPVSGPGSTLVNAKPTVQLLSKLEFSSVLDLGCGDLTWISQTGLFNKDYTGYDIVEELIESNKERYPDKEFDCKNIIKDKLKDADLLIVRDVLFHLKIEDILALFQNIVNYNFKYIFLTSCRNEKNVDSLNKYHFHQINLTKPPFNIAIDQILYRNSEEAFNRDIFIVELKYFKKNFEAKTKIPKILHQIWIGNKPFPDNYSIYRDSWEKHFPNWEYKFWGNSDIEGFNMKNIEAFKSSKSWAQKADIWRYEILERYGGIYIDCDFECLRNFSDKISTLDFFSAYETNKIFRIINCSPINIAIIGSIPHHPITKTLIENLPKHVKAYASERINIQTGPIYFTKVIKKFENLHLTKNVRIFTPIHFYPYYFDEEIPKSYSTETYCVHHWGAEW
jgi:mannosyltransferase OCH1-like enzyme